MSKEKRKRAFLYFSNLYFSDRASFNIFQIARLRLTYRVARLSYSKVDGPASSIASEKDESRQGDRNSLAMASDQELPGLLGFLYFPNLKDIVVMTSTKVVPLEALLRRMSRMAENMFDKDGFVTMTWLVDTASDQGIIQTPMLSSGVEYKDDLADTIRKHFKEIGVCRYAMAMEVWCWNHEHTERQGEAVQIIARDSHQLLTALHDIIRPVHGKPYLEKLQKCKLIAEGRFTAMLPQYQNTNYLQ
jgi:hypothetical protein